jgi:CO/xanthine dehydrogenase Mo-binding subunit
MLDLPMSKVRIQAMEVGGGFGGKVSVVIEPLVAALALKTGRPVKLVYTRQDELEDARPRCGTAIRVKTGAKRDGTLVARELNYLADNGAYADWGPATVLNALRAGCGPYRIPNTNFTGAAIYTNKFVTGPFRAPGYPQLTFAIESQMDDLAAELGMDPIELRRKNLLRNGDKTYAGTTIEADAIWRCLDAVATAVAEDPADEPNTGWGVACGEWETGGHPAAASLKVNEDGTVALIVGSTDLTGSLTSIAQVVAAELGLDMSDVSAVSADTDSGPFAPISGGSMVTYNMTHTARKAAAQVADELKARAAESLGVAASELAVGDKKVYVADDAEKSVSVASLVADEPAGVMATVSALPATHSYAVHGIKVRVDPDTGEVRVLRAVSALDCGKAINPAMVEGQMAGGLAQGLGEGLWEEIVFDDDGRVANLGFGDYRLPTALDVPNVECHIIEGECSTSTGHGCKGVGEPVHVPALAAVANAVFAATGRRVCDSALNPVRVLGPEA